MKVWLIRAISITPVLITLAFICKWYLIEPYSMSTIEFEIHEAPLKKGDRENILNYEMKWKIIKGEWI